MKVLTNEFKGMVKKEKIKNGVLTGVYSLATVGFIIGAEMISPSSKAHEVFGLKVISAIFAVSTGVSAVNSTLKTYKFNKVDKYISENDIQKILGMNVFDKTIAGYIEDGSKIYDIIEEKNK